MYNAAGQRRSPGSLAASVSSHPAAACIRYRHPLRIRSRVAVDSVPVRRAWPRPLSLSAPVRAAGTDFSTSTNTACRSTASDVCGGWTEFVWRQCAPDWRTIAEWTWFWEEGWATTTLWCRCEQRSFDVVHCRRSHNTHVTRSNINCSTTD